MTRDHDPHLADQMQIGALQQAGNRDADEPSRYGWLVVAATFSMAVALVVAAVYFILKSGATSA